MVSFGFIVIRGWFENSIIISIKKLKEFHLIDLLRKDLICDLRNHTQTNMHWNFYFHDYHKYRSLHMLKICCVKKSIKLRVFGLNYK